MIVSKSGISIGYQNYREVPWDDVAKGATDGSSWEHEGETVKAGWEFGQADGYGEGLICLTSTTVDDPDNPLIVYYFHEK